MYPLKRKLQEILAQPFVRGVLTFQMGSIAMMALGFVSSVVYTRMLGVNLYGVYGIITAFVGLLSIVVSFGHEITLPTFLAEAVGRKDEKESSIIIRHYLQSNLLANIIFLVLIWLAPTLAVLMQNEAEIGLYARVLLLSYLFQFAPGLLLITLQVRRYNVLVTSLENIRAIFQFIISAFLLLCGFGVWSLLYGTLIVSIVYMPLSLYLYERYRGNFPSLLTIFTTILQFNTLSYFYQGLWIGLERNIGKKIYPNLFFIILGATTSNQTVGIFQLAFRLVQIPSEFIMPGITRMTLVAIPKMVGGNRKALKTSCLKLLKGTFSLSILTTIGAAVTLTPLVPYLYGQEYAAAIPVFLSLIIINPLASLHVISVPLARVYKKIGSMMFVNITGCFVALILYKLLLPVLYPLFSMSTAIIIYHVWTLLIFAILGISIKKRYT